VKSLIPFNRPAVTGREIFYIHEVINSRKICGDGRFTFLCQQWLSEQTGCPHVLLTPSCTHALELCAILMELKEGDEVILPSYTFSSTANAFALRGIQLVFVDICPKTMNIDPKAVEAAITERTKAIIVVHYAGVSCDMDAIMALADSHRLFVIEDAAQGVMSTYMDKSLGTMGHLGCYSFHETKNVTSGEGGALLINDSKLIDRAEIIREKGTNRKRFLDGHVDKYSWVDIGSSYLLGELSAAYLYAQLEGAEPIHHVRLKRWEHYYTDLLNLQEKGMVELPLIPESCAHNAHMFYMKVKDVKERQAMIAFLKRHGIMTAFHYNPLHKTLAGRQFGRFHGEDRYTTKESECLLRLPLYADLSFDDVHFIVERIHDFYDVKSREDMDIV